jgi:hypothetical protein
MPIRDTKYRYRETHSVEASFDEVLDILSKALNIPRNKDLDVTIELNEQTGLVAEWIIEREGVPIGPGINKKGRLPKKKKGPRHV